MKAGALPGGDAVCHGHHVWDEDECLRCGLIDISYREKPQPDCLVQGSAKLPENSAFSADHSPG